MTRTRTIAACHTAAIADLSTLAAYQATKP